jgi:hypothetical protein
MASEDKRVKVTSEYEYDPDGRLIKKITECPPKKTDRVTLIAQIAAALAVVVSILALAVGVFQFKAQQSDSAKQALDQQHQTTLDTYFDRMQELLLAKPDDFKANNPGDEYQSLAEARTFTVLRNLDGLRKGTLVRFLEDAYLIGYVATNGSVQPPILNLRGSDLSGAVFAIAAQAHPDLTGISLKYDNLYGVNLSGVDLSHADLSYDYLQGANLSSANLNGTLLQGARYNTKTTQVNDVQEGITLILQPTQWPQGFNPKAVGAICDDC